ncbi:MAG: homocysteine S-methyltransferase family protein [Anaerofustis stercorihominis]|nr:homocysteine S-methyltransferase family protein [Anaerofustis stercorihominis]
MKNIKYPLLIDGSMGALLISKGLGSDSASLNVENYEVIRDIHKAYIDAGANIILTNTFALSAKEGHNKYSSEELINGAMKAALEAKGERYDVYVALDIGPCGLDMYPLGDSEYDDSYEFYKKVISLGYENADFIFCETFTNLTELNSAIDAAKDVCDKPVIASMTFNEKGYTMMGVSVEEFVNSMNERNVFAAGVNCLLLPEDMKDVAVKIKSLLNKEILTFCQPNRGAPKMVDGKISYEMAENDFAEGVVDILRSGVDFVGGCCGSNEECIRLIHETAEKENLGYRG